MFHVMNVILLRWKDREVQCGAKDACMQAATAALAAVTSREADALAMPWLVELGLESASITC
jgi:hypothetical protein